MSSRASRLVRPGSPDDEADWRAAVLDATGAALVGVDSSGRTVYWSARAQLMFGWSAHEVLGEVPPNIPLPLLREWQVLTQRVIDSGEPTPATETQRVTRDGRIVPVVHSGAPLHAPDGTIVGVLETLMDISLLKQLDDESRALAQVRERELIAMDLHDGLIQGLYGLMLSLDARRRSLDPPHAGAAETLTSARETIDALVGETRTYLFDLRSRHFTPSDLGAGLRLLADGLRLNGDIKVDLRFDPSVEQPLQPEVRGHLLYLAREAVSNVLRHAHARSVCIEVARSDDHLLLTVVDDGIGLSVSPTGPPGSHHGLRNMAERARLIGGRLDISSPKEGGTRVSVDVPLYRQSRR